MPERLDQLETETRNPRTIQLDTVDTLTLVQLLHAENHTVAGAVDPLLPLVAKVIDGIVERLEGGGRLMYVGAGTSGRLGVLDASECPPTFGVDPGLVQGIIAGGQAALTSSIEDAEDSPDQGAADMRERVVTASDYVIGIAASGRTPYVVGALYVAAAAGAATAAIVNVSNSVLSAHADITLAAVTGPEPLTGSTRMKAGTAQKLLLNMISTGTMVRLGKAYSNLMVDVRATNHKLQDRANRIVMSAVGCDKPTALTALDLCGGSAKKAIVMLMLHTTADQASALLDHASGHVSVAIKDRVKD